MLNNVEYKISLHPSRFVGYQSKNGNRGEVKLYVGTLWFNNSFEEEKDFEKDFEWFLEDFIHTLILERICLERAFQKIRLKNRCGSFHTFTCKMDYITSIMMN